jgi:uncharacterized metal-binding protein YceD (DUF177 family)
MILTEDPGEAEPLSGDSEWDGVTDDVLIAGDSRIIPDADVLEMIVLEIPPFALCSDDCPGLCPICGKHLKDGDCGCRAEKQINPKLEILRTLLEDQEEDRS